ncbi:3-deoxy-D-manno-octulosonic acid transferase [Tateyamaria sp.]|uniref:3-deoxy-D-manno-octulosonic acid transferase n=1 Tax=Tateyamaria sp. TaxID=1929288 RepID=UPI0032A0F3D9
MRPTALFYLYRAATTLALPFMARASVNTLRRAGVSVDRAHERLGHATADRRAGPMIWIYAADEDDVTSVLPLITDITRTHPDAMLLLTSNTAAAAQAAAGQSNARAVHQFSPLEGTGPIDRFLRHWRPDLCVLVNSDLWPNLLDRCAHAGVPVALLDVHLADASAQGWKRFPATASYVLRGIIMAECRDMASRNHLRDMGLELARMTDPKTLSDPQMQGKTRQPLATRLFALANDHAVDVMR